MVMPVATSWRSPRADHRVVHARTAERQSGVIRAVCLGLEGDVLEGEYSLS